VCEFSSLSFFFTPPLLCSFMLFVSSLNSDNLMLSPFLDENIICVCGRRLICCV
jgi:hypothetical protein